jgi:uncharacterized protein with PQ loop repeat
MEIIGWVGSICFSICAIPQAYQSIKKKHSRGINYSTLWLWAIGEVCMIIYEFNDIPSLPRLSNYLFNIGSLAVILYYKHFPKDEV